MATELAKAYVQIIPSAQGIKGKLGETLGGESTDAGKSAGKTFGSSMASTIKNVLATAAIGKALASTISEGAALQQSLGGIETLFKDSADVVKANAAKAYQTAGMSANEYMELTTSFSASLLSSLSNDTAKAAEIADMAMVDMSDNANKMGTNMEDIKNAYQGFAKQNYTMLDNLKLGYGGTQSEMKRLLEDAQKISGVKYDINNLADVYSAIHVIQEELDITGTTSKEAATTISGSMASMKAAFKNVLGEITLGMDVGPALNALAETVSTFFVGNLLPALANILMALPGALVTFIQSLVPQLLTAISETFPQLAAGVKSGIPHILDAAASGLAQLDTTLHEHLPELLQNGIDMISNIVNGILSNLPALLTSMGNVLSALLELILSNLPTILQAGAKLLVSLAKGIVNNIPTIVSTAMSVIRKLISTILSHLPQILQTGIEIIGKLAAGLIRAIPSLVAQIPRIINAIKREFTSIDWGSVGINIISGIASGIRNAAGQLWEAARSTLGNFKDKILGFFGIHSPSKWGAWVGEMLDTGVANGISGNTGLVSKAADELTDSVKSPLSGDLAYTIGSNYAVGNSSQSTEDTALKEKIDTLITLLMKLLSKPDGTKIVMNNREVGRVLQELGVVFE